MSLIKKSAVAVAAVLAAPLALVATAPAAQAAVGDTAPSCIKRNVQRPSSNAYVWIQLTNKCSTTKKVKIVISWGSDGSCWTMKPGTSRSWTYDGLGDYDKTVLC
ncbi:beta-Ig-H3/fasciclin [Streptomyces sp. NPDC057682]|uniref:beta-Ig-H3/fasciclin n=1 Tax=unclassified Streptomyces TaxID=2593676 RepID=UPI00364F34A8